MNKKYSRESNKRVNTDHFTLQNPTSTRPYWIPTRSVSSEAWSAEATEIFFKMFRISNFLQFHKQKTNQIVFFNQKSIFIKRVFCSKNGGFAVSSLKMPRFFEQNTLLMKILF